MNKWLEQWYSAQATSGGVIRRSRDDVERLGGGIDQVIIDASERGWHVIETGGQVVILCHDGSMTVHC